MRYFIFSLMLAFLLGCGELHRSTGDSPYVEECLTAYNQDIFPIEANDILVFNLSVTAFVYPGDTLDEAEVNEMVWSLNNLFAQADIQFEFVEYKTIESKRIAENMGSYREHAKAHFSDNAINVFVYPSSETVHQYQVMAGIAGGVPSTYFAIRQDFIGANMTTAAHEMGHVMGLFHTHKEDDSDVKYNVYTGDFICDTPMSYSLQSRVTQDCDYTGLKRGLRNSEIKVLVRNIMSYSYPACREDFTDVQIKRMRFVIANSADLRNALVKY